MVCRIFTEDLNRNGIISIVSAFFDSFTLIPAIGYWQGAIEKSLIIEVSGYFDDTMIENADEIAKRIRILNKQDSVLVQYVDCKSELK